MKRIKGTRKMKQKLTIEKVLDLYLLGYTTHTRIISKAKVIKDKIGKTLIDERFIYVLRAYIKEREEVVCPQTVRHELNLITAALKDLEINYGLQISDRAIDMKIAEVQSGIKAIRSLNYINYDNERDRRPSEDELFWLRTMARKMPNQMIFALELAIETGLRKNELIQITWSMVDLKRQIISLPKEITKMKKGRKLPFSKKVQELLITLQIHTRTKPTILNMKYDTLGSAWKRCREQAWRKCPSVLTLRWHDFRHEAISRLAEKGWSIPQMMVVSGHRDQRCLIRYVDIKAEDIVTLLDIDSDKNNNKVTKEV